MRSGMGAEKEEERNLTRCSFCQQWLGVSYLGTLYKPLGEELRVCPYQPLLCLRTGLIYLITTFTGADWLVIIFTVHDTSPSRTQKLTCFLRNRSVSAGNGIVYEQWALYIHLIYHQDETSLVDVYFED
jgi:hypothetical protein